MIHTMPTDILDTLDDNRVVIAPPGFLRWRKDRVIAAAKKGNVRAFEVSFKRRARRFLRLAHDNVLYHSLLGWTGGNRFLDHLSEMATIRSSGLPLLNAPNGIPGPWRVSED